MDFLSNETLFWIIFSIPSIIIASTVHEYAHAFAAFKLGDPTAKAEGRLTLNPLSHIDPIGAIAMIIFRFGWSKPVPINEYNFEHRELGTAITAFAGPLSNMILALLAALVNLIFNPNLDTFFGIFLLTFAMINISLAVFNLIPIPPLDGHKIVRAFLPKKIRYYWEEMEKFSVILLIILLVPFSSFVSNIIGTVISYLLSILGFL